MIKTYMTFVVTEIDETYKMVYGFSRGTICMYNPKDIENVKEEDYTYEQHIYVATINPLEAIAYKLGLTCCMYGPYELSFNDLREKMIKSENNDDPMYTTLLHKIN